LRRVNGWRHSAVGDDTHPLGAIARKYGVWISAALLEAVEGGAYDTNVLIDPDGRVVHKQRKAFCYPSFAGTPCFQGNYQAVRAVPSPWGLLAVMNCADTNAKAKRALIAALGPSLVLVNFANPQANLLRQCNDLAAECRCPVVGATMILPPESKLRGGKSRVASAEGKTLWEAGDTEAMQVCELTVRVPNNLPPTVEAGDTQAVRLPRNRVALRGRALDDGRPGPLKTAWVKASGPGSVSFADASAPATEAAFSAPGVYVLRLTAGDGALSASDAATVTVLPADGSDPSLVGYWPFDGTAEDRSGKGNHAQLKGQAALVADPAPTGSPNAGALSLRGDGVAMVPHAPSLDAPESVTVALWFKFRSLPPMWPTRQSGWVAFLSKGKWWKENYAIGVGEYFYLFARAYGEMNCPSLEKTVRETGRWHHVSAVFDAQGRRGQIYIDGVLNHSIANAPIAWANTEPIYFGRFSHESAGLDGLLDDVRVYARALADDEIAALVPGAKVNRPPAVEAGPDLILPAADTAHLKGSVRDDEAFPSSRAAGWVFWRKVAGPGDVRLGNAFAPATTATFTRPGRYILELRASDGAHLAADTVIIVVE
jgi:hypothetical protein